MFDTLPRRVAELAQTQPNKPAVAFKKDQLTYKELWEKANAVASSLAALGIKQGDLVCYTALSKPEMPVLYLAIHLLGAVAVFLDKNATPQSMRDVYDTAEAAILFTDKPMKEFGKGVNLHSLRVLYQGAEYQGDVAYTQPEPEALAEILFTTGTTGKPKGVMLSYRAVYNILTNTATGTGLAPEDIILHPLPLNHSFPLRVLRAALYQGASLVLQNGFTFATEVEKNIDTYACTGMCCVPASFELLKSQMQGEFARILGGLRYIEFGAGSLSVGQRQEIKKLLPATHIVNTWGSSESGGAIFCDIDAVVQGERNIAALGKPLEGKCQVRVLAADGTELANSTMDNPGRLAVKGDMIMSGYWKAPDLTADALQDGWLVTNDLVFLRDGYVFMLGRADDIINVGGEKASPLEIENVVSQYPHVVESACIGVDDPEGILGQVPVLYVVGDADYNEDELHKFLASQMEKYKLPRKYIQIEAIPRNRMKKIDRKAIHELWANQGKATNLTNPVVNAMLTRHSVRKFTNQPVAPEALDIILKCGYHAPSGHNMQSWKFTVIENPDTIARLREATKTASKEHKVHFYGWENPAVLILVSNDNRNDNGCQDASLAAGNMLLAAHSLGLGAVWLNPLRKLRDAAGVKELLDEFGIPAGHTVWATIALGWPAAAGTALAKKTNVITYVDR